MKTCGREYECCLLELQDSPGESNMKRFAVFVAVVVGSVSGAQETADLVGRQRDKASGYWKNLEAAETKSPVESPHFMVFGRAPVARLKTVSQQLEAAFVTASKPLKYAEKEGPWPGKLAVFVLPNRNDFVRLARIAGLKSPESDDTVLIDISGDQALLIVGPPRVGSADPELAAREEMVGLMLQRKFGTMPPSWLKTGFVRATLARINRPSGKVINSPTVPFEELWNNRAPEAIRHQAATYFVDYWAYGPGSEWFDKFLAAARPGENNRMPTVEEMARSLNWNVRDLELFPRLWKKPSNTDPSVKPKKKY